MITPTVTELPRQAEPTSAGPLLDHGPGRQGSAPLMRELDRRRNDGIDVRLLWNQTDDRVVVTVFDAKTSDAFKVEVAPYNALDAFHHPYAYAPNDNGRPHNELAV
jgi:hypothetical protein